MKCVYCEEEREKGIFSAINTMRITDPITQRFTSDEEMSKKGLKAAIFRKSVALKKNEESWYCKNCKKVISIFDVRE